MAGIFERMAMIAKSNVNDLIDRFEDPEKMVDQAILDAKTEYGKVKKESLAVLANETTTKKDLDRLNAEANKWHGIAASALKAGNEGDARTALSKENDLRDQAATQKITYEAAKAAADKLREKLKEMENEISEMEKRSAQIKAMAVTAKATNAANRVSERGINRGAFEAFDRMESKAKQQLAEAEALESLNRNTGDAEERDLEKKYSSGTPGVDEALAKLKEEIGQA
ncbi:MAG: PspA/IM30 family protein [Clostridiales bacterium]|nr:PspA/IM30 family protein [Clostridiales bacterium]